MSGTITGTVRDVRYVSTTKNGNTRHRITLTDGEGYVTAPDSSAGLDAQNLRTGDRVSLVTDGRHEVRQVIDVVPSRRFVVTFDPRPQNVTDGLRRVTLEEARDIIATAARIPKVGRIIDTATGREIGTRRGIASGRLTPGMPAVQS